LPRWQESSTGQPTCFSLGLSLCGSLGISNAKSSLSGQARRPISSTQNQSLSMSEWQKPYLAALMELDQDALSTKIAAAEAAVAHHARELTTVAWDIDEHHALRDAAFSLHLLKCQSAKG
jgi:hypothetical protein